MPSSPRDRQEVPHNLYLFPNPEKAPEENAVLFGGNARPLDYLGHMDRERKGCLSRGQKATTCRSSSPLLNLAPAAVQTRQLLVDCQLGETRQGLILVLSMTAGLSDKAATPARRGLTLARSMTFGLLDEAVCHNPIIVWSCSLRSTSGCASSVDSWSAKGSYGPTT
eukprot:6479378-Amphidinium_carterae.1